MNWLKIFVTFLIFIVIIGTMSVIYQLFFEDIPKNIVDTKTKSKEIITTYTADLKPSLSEVEKSRQNGIKPYQTKVQLQKVVKIKDKYKPENGIKEVFTLEDIKEKLNKNSSSKVKNKHTTKPTKNIYNKQHKETFEILKTLLVKASKNNISTQQIVLNSSISSILYSQNQRDRFFQLISQEFQLPLEVVEELSYNNGYLWDWIVELNKVDGEDY